MAPVATALNLQAEHISCHEFCCSKFALYDNEVLTKRIDLDDPVTPVFRPESFSDTISYPVIKPCIQLASKLLESNALVPYINTVFDGEIRDANGRPTTIPQLDVKCPASVHDSDWESAVFPKVGQDELNEYTKLRAKDILERMADMVEFDLSAALPDNNCCRPAEPSSGRMLAIGGPLPPKIRQFFPHGCRCRIELSRTRYERLEYLTHEESRLSEKELDEFFYRDELLLLRFDIAETLVHEVGHGFGAAAHGGQKPEIFYRDSKMTESGYEMTAQLFGGIFAVSAGNSTMLPWRGTNPCTSGRVRKTKRFVLLRTWPSELTRRLYMKDGGVIAWKNIRARSYDIIWRVPLSYIEALFTTEFWHRVEQQGVSALRPPTVAARAFQYVERKDGGGILPMAHATVKIAFRSMGVHDQFACVYDNARCHADDRLEDNKETSKAPSVGRLTKTGEPKGGKGAEEVGMIGSSSPH